ncbi:hypothetical protein JCM3766R1_005371 [Sporobolomyces carnicolor]
MTASDPETPVSDTESIMVLDSDDDQDIEPSEQPLTREPPSSLAARFRNLCQTSPSPPPESLSVPVPPPSPQKTLSRPAGYRPIASRTPVANNMPRCDRNLPCATCSMRRVKCTWNQAGSYPADLVKPSAASAAKQVAANRAEISRLRKEANTLARLLRLTPHEFDKFHAEANRLVEGPRGESAKPPPSVVGHKRPRVQDAYDHGPSHKLPRRLEDRVVHRLKHRSSFERTPGRPPSYSSYRPSSSYSQWTSTRPREAGPPMRTSPERPVNPQRGLSTSPLLAAAKPPASIPSHGFSAPRIAPIHGRPVPQSRSSFSTLPPLKIPSVTVSRPPSAAVPPRSAHPATSTSATPRRRPHYVLPTPVYSSTPTSASFFPLANLSSSTTTTTTTPSSKPMAASKSWPLYSSRYESTTLSRTQPYTPLSAVRDEGRDLGEARAQRANSFTAASPENGTRDLKGPETVREGDRAQPEVDVKRDGEVTPAISISKIITPKLKNLLND